MYRLNLLGGVSIASPAGPLGGTVTQRRRLALLALLAGSPTGAMSRERLSAFLFPEADSAHAHKGVADALHGIRTVLGREALVAAGGEIRLNPALVHSDVAEWRSACASGDCERAVTLYRGPFLDGFFIAGAPEFERWVETTRNTMAAEFGRLLAAAAEVREEAGELPGAVACWRRLSAHDPDSTYVVLRLVSALERLGDPSAALGAASLHHTMLRETLGVEPPDDLRHAIERLHATAPTLPAAPTRAEPCRPDGPESPGRVPPGSADVVAVAKAPRSWRRRTLLAGGAGVGVAFALFLGLPAARRSAAADPPAPIRSVAVLPLEDLARDPGEDFFADGMTDALITELARRGDVRVIARTSVIRYRGAGMSVRSIARELGVDAVIEGTVLREGPRVRIGARLSRGADEELVWAESYVRDMSELLPLQAEIARAIAGAVRVRVGPRTESPAAPRRPVDPEAYVFYLKAQHLWNEDAMANQREAVRYLDAALAREPDFAPAHALLAEIYVHLVEWQTRDADIGSARARALASVSRALALDDGLAEAHTSLAHLLMHQEEWDASEREYRRALELNPSYAYARILYAFHLVALRRSDEAIREAEQAAILDPLSARTQDFAAYTLFAARRYDAAAGRWARMLDLHPGSLAALTGIARARLHGGRVDEGLRWAARAAEQQAATDSALTLAYAYAVARRPADAHAALRVALGAADARRDPLDLAMVYAALDDRSEAFAWLERAIAEEHGWTMFLDVDAAYDPLRQDPRFTALLRRMRLRR